MTLYEKNEKLGKKIYITGKGRCNVTNNCSRDVFFDQVVTNPKFLYSAFETFDNQAVMQLLEQAGCPLKTERGNRVFPVSDHSSDVIRALERLLQREGVKVHLRSSVKRVLEEDGQAVGLELSDGKRIQADSVIVATGGLSYPSTGSTGDGYRWAEATGHKVVACTPSLVSFVTEDTWCAKLQGLALKNVNLVLYFDGKEIYQGFGEMLFTHFGVSGPLVLSASSYYSAQLAKWTKKNEKKKISRPECRIELNLKPALTAEQLDKRLLREFDSQKNKNFGNAIDGLFPARLIPVMLELSGIEPEKKVHEITKQERQKFAALIRKLPMTVEKTGEFAEAIITRGGVYVKDVNPSTMESKRLPGLYFAGEVLDVDALTGGFNLQVAWSTGLILPGRARQAAIKENKMGYSIAIDGPAGAGKSTIAKKVAAKKGCCYVDTGAIYRAMAYFLLENGVKGEETDRIAKKCQEANIRVAYEAGEQQVFLNGENVNSKIRTEEVGQMASKSAAVPQVRSWLIDLQRDLAVTQDVIMDGRDIGTCVLPQATVKIYLTASADVRAKRRYDEYRAKGMDCDYEEILNTVKKRDMQDMTRAIAPLKQADDAVLLDTSDLSIEEVVDRILEICAEKGC